MTASERPYWRTSILSTRFFSNEKSKDAESKTKHKQDDILQSSLLHSARLKKNLAESRKAFFNMEENHEINRNELINEKIAKFIDKEKSDKTISQTAISQNKNLVSRRLSNKKISFKIKKTSSIYRKFANNNRVAAVSANSVAELTSRFNKLVTTKNVADGPKLSKLVNKVNNLKNKEDPTSASKIKSNLDQEQQQIYFIRRPSVKRKASVRKFSESNSVKNKSEVGKVKATIEIFETITSGVSPTNECKDFSSLSSNVSNKPKVPEKKFGQAVIDIVNKNKERSTKIQKAKLERKAQEESLWKNDASATSALAESVQIIIAQTLDVDSFDETKTEIMQVVVNLPIITKRCDSNYETLNVSKVSPKLLERRKNSTNEEDIELESVASKIDEATKEGALVRPKTPNKSFLWSRNMPEYPQIKLLEELEELYDKVDQPTATNLDFRRIPPRSNNVNLNSQLAEDSDKIYEDVVKINPENYEYCTNSSTKYEELDDGYEYCQNIDTEETDNIYETLPTPMKDKTPINDKATIPPRLPPKKQQVPLPPRPPSRNPSFYSQQERMSNCYESIYNASSVSKRGFDLESNYESIDECLLSVWGSASNESSDDKSNSLYVYGKCQSDRSDRSASDRTDDWIDLSDEGELQGEQEEVEEIIVVREKSKVGKRNSGWSQKCREQRKKAGPSNLFDKDGDTDSDHIYESLCGTTPKENTPTLLNQQTAEEENDVYDSFDSDSECEYNMKKDTQDNIDITNAKLPQLPVNQTSVSTIAKTLRKNFTKSFHKMTKRKSESENLNTKSKEANLYQNITFASTTTTNQNKPAETQSNIAIDSNAQMHTERVKKGSIFNKFRRSMTFVSDSFTSDPAIAVTAPINEQTPSPIHNQRPMSIFYLTDTIDFTTPTDAPQLNRLNNKAKYNARPQNPPPPTPSQPDQQSPNNNQLYTETGVFKPDNKQQRKSNTNWYADVGLYQEQQSTNDQEQEQQQQEQHSPSTSTASSSAENSGSTVASSFNQDKLSLVDREEYYNLRNDRVSYDDGSDLRKKSASCCEEGKMHRWLDEPLYQFYDAAILESEYKNSTQNFDYDGYEEVGKIRPSAMELIAPVKNSIGSVSRTLWCEVPEVVQSAVLSRLSETQQKIQEAKFEMLTSEASYLHSLNVLVDHFVKNIKHSELLTDHESKLLFGNIFAVRDCSEKLLTDLEKCWQDNILLTNICDIVNKHAEQNFHVYITFCENQIFLDSTLNKLKERLSFSRYLEQLERSTACHSLKLNSFLLLPMQRITRWRLLIDAVLKRLVVEDSEYLSSRNTMATLTKIAQQCNEAARCMERTLEMQQISKQLEFGKGVQPFHILENGNNTNSRFLIKSGALTQMVAKTSDLKVTFGKRFTKIPLYLFLFNDILLITKARSKDNYFVLHYCYRNFIELNSEDSLESLPLKNAQGRHLIFLTILENHEEKLVELLLSCESVSDKERWLEAILPPKSENPDEIIYENWDCPQVTAVHNYTASQPDEMSLVKGDVINVDKKLTDGWFHGEKISDNQIGWFPSNYTITITNQHVRARNLKMRYRLLAFSTNYILNNQ